ncbi:MAG: chorismate-binding protein, partial [bacterium]|nr:chorismate-binding protein [bacterium]
MKFRPQFEEALKLTDKYKSIPITTEIFSDVKTPVQVLKLLKEAGHHCFLLESAEKSQKWGRYSFLGFNPTVEISCINGNLTIIDEEGKKEFKTGEPEKYVKELIEENSSPDFDYLPTFIGGLVGYFSYDFIKYTEPNLNLDAKDTENFKDLDLMLFDKVIAFDNVKQKIILIVNIKTDNFEENYENAILTLSEIADLIKTKNPENEYKGKLTSEFKPLFSEKEFCEMVKKAKNYIVEGDIFQVVLSNRLEAGFEGSLLNTYRYLRTTNPSPYMFYFSSD